MALLIFACLAYTELQNRHVGVDMLVARFRPRGRALCEAFGALLSAGFWGAIAWRTGLQATRLHAAGETSSNLLVPVWPFILAAAVGSAVFALVLLVRVLEALQRVRAS